MNITCHYCYLRKYTVNLQLVHNNLVTYCAFQWMRLHEIIRLFHHTSIFYVSIAGSKKIVLLRCSGSDTEQLKVYICLYNT